MADTAKQFGTLKAKNAAERAMEAVIRAQIAAELAVQQAATTQQASDAAVRAKQQDLCSPMKGTLKGAKHFFDTKPHPPEFSEGQPLDIKKYQDALAQLSNGAAVIDFPPQAIDYEGLPSIVEGIKTNPNLTHLNLRRSIPTNTMTDAITTALQGNQTLVYLNLSGNKMGDMAPEEPNLTALTKLKSYIDECETLRHIDVSENNFGAAGTEQICQGIRESISIRTLDLSGNNVLTGPEGDDEAVENAATALKDMLTKNKFLNTLVLKNNLLSNEQVEMLADSLKVTTRLTHLDMSGNVLGSPGATLIGGIMAENKGLKVLDLSDNKIGWKGIVNLADAIANKNSVLTSLIIQKNKFGISKEKQLPPAPTGDEEDAEPEPEDPEEAEARRKEEAAKAEKEYKAAEKAVLKLAEMMKVNNVLKDLDIAFNSIGHQQLCLLTEELKTNTSLTNCNFEMNHMCSTVAGEFYESAITSLAEALAVNSTLKSLNLTWNFLQAQGIDILAPSLAKNSGLRVLNLSRNFIGDDGLRTLTKALVSNASLISLSLAANEITSRGAKSVAKLLNKGSKLQILDLSENLLEAEGLEVLAGVVPGTDVRALDLSQCAIGDAPEALQVLLGSGSQLEKLDMGDNPVSTTMVDAATQALKRNTCLRGLMLWGRQDGDNDLQAELAVELLQENSTITALDFGFANANQELMDRINNLLRKNSGV
uniref:Uncharacterized protein n=1 Tax=Eutreptiella gymnastica TaxID=73025 RepID=A0A7S1IVT4_9EUGL|mmetsp:Transcript_46828/g.83976  ORF Transcript_46828/g.83976 Transcript_46828/m.83976 type:complete len:708 (+) Transcript_46828:102-2225(+)